MTSENAAMLARLMAQAQGQGADLITLRALVEEASECGAERALGAWWPGLTLQVDVDQVTALAEDRERLWAQVSAAEFLSDAEKREMHGFGRVQ